MVCSKKELQMYEMCKVEWYHEQNLWCFQRPDVDGSGVSIRSYGSG